MESKAATDRLTKSLENVRRVTAHNTRTQLVDLNTRLGKILELAEDEDKALVQPVVRVMLLDVDEETGVTYLELATRALIREAIKGNVKALALLFDRADGKVGESRATRDTVQKIAIAVTQLQPLARAAAEGKPLSSVVASSRVADQDESTGEVPPPRTSTMPEKGCTPLEPRLPHSHVGSPISSSPSTILDAEFVDEPNGPPTGGTR